MKIKFPASSQIDEININFSEDRASTDLPKVTLRFVSEPYADDLLLFILSRYPNMGSQTVELSWENFLDFCKTLQLHHQR